MASWLLRFIFDHHLKQWPTDRKKGRTEGQKFEYLELFRWNKTFFIVFEGLSFGEKNKNLMKIAGTSFKHCLQAVLMWENLIEFCQGNWGMIMDFFGQEPWLRYLNNIISILLAFSGILFALSQMSIASSHDWCVYLTFLAIFQTVVGLHLFFQNRSLGDSID